jgi:cysteine-rich repeat protein
VRTKLNSTGLAALMAITGLAASFPIAGCGGDGQIAVTSRGTGAEGGNGGAGGAGGTGGEGEAVCGNGTVEGLEACDDANMMSGDGCEADCNFTCSNKSPVTGDLKCDDTDPCNGAEKCQDDHTCAPGVKAPDGTSCTNGQICVSGVCSQDQCGDLYVSVKEECEDGNVVDGDGCDTCAFSCLSNDPARNCTNLDPCVATTCDDATHICGSPLPDGTTCAMGSICKNGACNATVCGDGILEGSEVCDDNNLVDGDGCDADCTRSCVNAATDCPAAPVCQVSVCDAAFVCVTNNVNSDAACVAPNTCSNGACQAPNAVCGNGILEVGEECDFGVSNGNNASCESNCKFSCNVDADCVDTNTCNGSETCGAVTVGGQMGKNCSAGTNSMDCSACMGGLCMAGVCTASTCGDGCIDTTAGEQCEPPSSMNCGATCKTVMCGNGVREAGEHCDDGNTTNMDGCNAGCQFEQVHRVTWLAIQYITDTYCTANRLGSAVTTQGQNTLDQALTTGVNNGSISIMFQALGLTDLSGTLNPSCEIGSLNGVPTPAPAGVTYNGASDVDWWYTVDAISLDPLRLPKDRLNASINAKVLNAGPGVLTLNILLAGSPAALRMSQTRLNATIGNATAPLISAMGNTPGHLPSENLNPALTSFETMALPNPNAAAKLCGNVSAESLDQVPVPMALLTGATACNQGYTTANSFLDVLIGGCNVSAFNVPVINIRQPDQQDPGAPDVGAGFPYMFTRDATTKKINGCRDKNNAAVNLGLCLSDAAYSAYFKFASDRVIGR